ncbi:hypothetical protein ETECTG_CDS0152 [Escherichia phage ETEC-TG]|nr:hypothetical protein ETECTG_CDS0152 [Escherichia phage ETEC-TG]
MRSTSLQVLKRNLKIRQSFGVKVRLKLEVG